MTGTRMVKLPIDEYDRIIHDCFDKMGDPLPSSGIVTAFSNTAHTEGRIIYACDEETDK